MKVLNLYSGIGGNRKLWEGVQVTAIELDPKIAAIYKDFFPHDEVIVTDAHQYLLEHFEEYDFIWSSPPCPSHCKPLMSGTYFKDGSMQYRPIYPDMKLYEEVIFLKTFFKGKWVVENVISYYEPLIKPHEIDSHFCWSNFHIASLSITCREHHGGVKKLQERKGFNLEKYSGIDKVKTLRNCVEPEVGLHILNYAMKKEDDLFKINTGGGAHGTQSEVANGILRSASERGDA